MLELRALTLGGIIVRITISMVVGGIIGVERGIKNRPAGIKTYVLVSLGACVVMMVNQYTYQVYGTGDPVRMGAQVVSGIGFLGAGTIIVTTHNQIKGLTTAAGLWASACIGLATGIGLYEITLTAGAAVFIVLAFLQGLDSSLRSRGRVVEMYIELDRGSSLGNFLRSARARDFDLSSIQKEPVTADEEGVTAFTVTVRGKRNVSHEEIVRSIRNFEGVRYLESL